MAALAGSFQEGSGPLDSNFKTWDMVVICLPYAVVPPGLQPSSEMSSSFLAETATPLGGDSWNSLPTSDKKRHCGLIQQHPESHLLGVWGEREHGPRSWTLPLEGQGWQPVV